MYIAIVKKSEKGASVSIALLLFLICAVLGTVVLTAGTAAAGRIGRAVEMDRRYYSVASAAELLVHELDNSSVTVTRSRVLRKVTEEEYSVTADSSGDTVSLTNTSIHYTAVYKTDINGFSGNPDDVTVETSGGDPVSAVGTAYSSADMSFVTARAAYLMFGDANCNTDAAMGFSFAESGHEEAETGFTMTHSAEGIDGEALGIVGAFSMSGDGTITIRIRDNGEKDNYTLIIKLVPAFDEKTNTADDLGAAPEVQTTDSGYIKTTTRTSSVIKLSTITWKVGSVSCEEAGE